MSHYDLNARLEGPTPDGVDEPIQGKTKKRKGKKNKKKGSQESEPKDNNPMIGALDKASKYGEQVGIIMSVLKPDYEGGDYCAGLTATFEAKSVMMKLIKGEKSKKSKKDLDSDSDEE